MVEVRSAESCQSTSTNPRRLHPYTLRSTTHPLSGSPPAHSSAADIRKHSPPVPLPRSAPRSISQRFAPPGPVWSVSPMAARRLQASGSTPAALVVVDTSYSAVPSEALHPILQPRRFDLLKALPIHSRRTMISSRQFVSMGQNIFSVHLVVKLIEPEFRLALRLSIQLDLKFPYLARRCQAHGQSPLLSFFSSTPEARALPSTGVTRLRWYLWPSPTPR